MESKNTVNMKLARCFVTIGARRYIAGNAKNLEASVDVTNAEVPMLGKLMTGHKTICMNGSGKMTIYWNTDVFTKLISNFKNFGIEPIFEIQETNEDITSSGNIGIHSTILKNCRVDGELMIAAFDADSEDVLEQEVEFTFDDFETPDLFNDLNNNMSVSGALSIAGDLLGRVGL